MAKEDATGQAVEPSMEQLLDINRKQSEIISATFCMYLMNKDRLIPCQQPR